MVATRLHTGRYAERRSLGASHDVAASLHATRWMFTALCAYILAQMFTIPLVAIGPWPVWPTLADLSTIFLITAWLLAPVLKQRQRVITDPPFVFSTLVVLCIFSYLLMTVVAENITKIEFASTSGIMTGAFQLLRLAQFAFVFAIAWRIPLDQFRRETLRRVAVCSLTVVCLMIVATYSGLVSQSAVVAHLPSGAVAAGPWQTLLSSLHDQGLGTIGYNHAYVAAHVTLLLALCLSLNSRGPVSLDIVLVIMALLAVTLTGSRSGLLACLLFVMTYIIRRAFFAFLLGSILILAVAVAPGALDPQIPQPDNSVVTQGEAQETLPILERQRTAFQFGDENNLSGRDSIWHAKVHELNRDPIRWITGWGFGTSADHGYGITAHMLPLQFVVELGLIGALAVFSAFAGLLVLLYRMEHPPRPIFLVTLALLFSSLSQETFYPVAAMGQFLGLYLVTIVIALNSAGARFPVAKAVRIRAGVQAI